MLVSHEIPIPISFMEVVGDGNGGVSMVVFLREEKGVVVFEFQRTPCF